MWNALKELLRSKKALVTITAILVWVLGRVGLDIDEATLLPVVASLATLVLGIAAADFGKVAEATRAEAAKELAGGAPVDPQ